MSSHYLLSYGIRLAPVQALVVALVTEGAVMTSQIPCRNLIAHSRTPESDVAKRLTGCDPLTCLRQRGRGSRSSMSSSVALDGNDQRVLSRRVLLKAHLEETLRRVDARAKKWRPAGRVIEKRAATKNDTLHGVTTAGSDPIMNLSALLPSKTPRSRRHRPANRPLPTCAATV